MGRAMCKVKWELTRSYYNHILGSLLLGANTNIEVQDETTRREPLENQGWDTYIIPFLIYTDRTNSEVMTNRA